MWCYRKKRNTKVETKRRQYNSLKNKISNVPKQGVRTKSQINCFCHETMNRNFFSRRSIFVLNESKIKTYHKNERVEKGVCERDSRWKETRKCWVLVSKGGGLSFKFMALVVGGMIFFLQRG